MAEVVVGLAVAAGASHLAYQTLAHQRLQPRYGFVVAAAAGRPQRVEVEPAADDGGRSQKLPASLVHTGQARVQQVAYTAWQRPIELILRACAGLAQRGQVLHHEERQALALVIQTLDRCRLQ